MKVGDFFSNIKDKIDESTIGDISRGVSQRLDDWNINNKGGRTTLAIPIGVAYSGMLTLFHIFRFLEYIDDTSYQARRDSRLKREDWEDLKQRLIDKFGLKQNNFITLTTELDKRRLRELQQEFYDLIEGSTTMGEAYRQFSDKYGLNKDYSEYWS